MTQDYAFNMWLGYLEAVTRTDDSRILVNPAIPFTKDAKAGYYDSYSDAAYDAVLKNVEEESSLFNDEPRASAYMLFLKAYRKLPLSYEELSDIAETLAKASSRIDFRHTLPPCPQEAMPSAGDSVNNNYAHSAKNAQKG